ncbi:MAG TPA: DUF2478 domain-containing protein [Roseiarcus sp.]|nr:DUF2478 domain-containing protein [Roseiarcus sp.]
MQSERAKRVAAIVFERNETPDPPLVAFIEAALRRGVQVAGLVQEHGDDEPRLRRDTAIRDIATGEALPIMQDLGADATGCRVDPSAIAAAAQMLARAVAARPDLLIVNRFGRLESQGGGMRAEIAQAFLEDIPLIVCVPRRYLGAWSAFADGSDAQIPPLRAAIEDWWTSLETSANVAI